MRKQLGVMISGRGSNMQAIVEACASGAIDADVALVLSDRRDAAGLDWAQQRGIDTAVVARSDHPDRLAMDSASAQQLHTHGCDYLLLAGYMRVLSEQFVTQFDGRALNIHPSLLPKYKGLHTHARALEAGDSHGGATVHFVSATLDSGAPLIQARARIDADDNADTLAAKVLPLEHRIYPVAAQWLLSGRLQLQQGHALLDGQPLLQPVQLEEL